MLQFNFFDRFGGYSGSSRSLFAGMDEKKNLYGKRKENSAFLLRGV
jgi:hypothetical protein